MRTSGEQEVRGDGGRSGPDGRDAAARHFARVASSYTALRITDAEPALHIRDRLPRGTLVGVDVGAGTGRYTELLVQLLGDRASLHAVDLSRAMLADLLQHGRKGEHGVVCCEAERLPLADRSVDFITSFNAVHHFDLEQFVHEAARALAPDGHLFIYTRTPEQNAASIWGRAFPGFASRENRLHDEATLCRILRCIGRVDVRSFCFARQATPAALVERVKGCAYSTFALYEADELDDALDRFLLQIDAREQVYWQDHNLLVHVSRAG